MPAPQGSQPQMVLQVTPQPYGAAARLVARRSAEGAGVPELPLEALAPAPRVTPRAASLLQYSGGYTRLSATQGVYVNQDLAADRYRLDRLDRISRDRIVSDGRTGSYDELERRRRELERQRELEEERRRDLEWQQIERDRLAWERQQETYDLLEGKLSDLSALRDERRDRLRAKQEAVRDVQGPSVVRAIDLLEGLYLDPGVPLAANDILRIENQVYGDANPATGVFYFVPKRYDLGWSPQEQYAMTVIYGMASQRAGEGQVYMAARLRAGVDLAEVQLAEELLRGYALRHSRDGVIAVRSLRPLPLAAASDVQLFGGASNEFTVPPEQISVQGISGLLGTMDVSWAIDVRRLLNVESLLRTDAGIHGNVTLHAAGQEAFSRQIPLEIAVASPETFGRIRFDRAGWVNRSVYPIRLHSLHALLVSPQDGGRVRKGDPIVYTWSLGGATIPPGVRVAWNAAAVPPWLDSEAQLLWVAYSVDGSCEACDDRVFTEKFIPELPSTREVVFTTGDVFEATGAYRIQVRLRSPFLDPRRSGILEQPAVELTEDGSETPVAQLFLTDRELTGEGASQPFYEFQVEIAMRDGSVTRSDWTPSRSLDFLLGSASLAELMGSLPGADDPGDEPAPQATAPPEPEAAAAENVPGP